MLEADGQIEDAAALWQESGDWKGVTRLSLKSAAALILQGRSHTLEAWLKTLPSELLSRTPWSLYWLGICRLPFVPTEAREHFEHAYAGFKADDELPGRYLAWCAVVDSFIYEWGNFKPLDRWIGEMEELLRSRPGFSSREIETQVTCGMFLALMYRQPHHPDLPSWEQRVWQIMLTGEDLQLCMKVGSHLLIYYTWWIGDLAKAELLLNSQRRLMQTPGTAPLVRVTWHTMAAGFYWVSAANEDCIACVDQGLEISRNSGVHTWDMLLYAQGVFASLCSGRMNTAAAYLKYMGTLMSTSRPMDMAVYYYMSGWDSFLRENLPRAYEQTQSAVSLADEAGAPFQAAMFRNAFGRVSFYAGKQNEAQTLLQQASAEGRAMRAKSIEYVTFIVEAELAMERQDEAACLEHLRRGLALGREQGYRTHTWWRPETMVRLYAKALEHHIEVDFVLSVIRKRRLSPPEDTANESWPWPVKIYSFGEFALEIDDKPAAVTRRGESGKPLALLKTLIAAGGRAVSQSTLTQALWPEAEGDSARRAFDTTLHRLRKLLPEDALGLEDGKLQLNAHTVWTDTRALGRELQRLEQALQGALLTPAQLSVYTQSVLRLYRGPFLPEEDAAWALVPREQWQTRLLQLLRRLGRYCEDQGALETALIYYEQGLTLDPCIEEFYQHLIRLYQRLERSAEAVATYARCRKALHTLLRINPSPATEKLYQELRKS